MKHLLPTFLRNNRGVAAIEFVFLFPMMCILLFGAVEVGRYIIITQRVEKAAYNLTELFARTRPFDMGTVRRDAIFDEVENIMRPFNADADQVMIISSVLHTTTGNLLLWQHSGGGTFAGTSIISDGTRTITAPVQRPAIGNTPTAITFPADITQTLTTALPNENFLVGEVIYNYRPIFAQILSTTEGNFFSMANQVLSRPIFMHPVNGDLISDERPPVGTGGGGATGTPGCTVNTGTVPATSCPGGQGTDRKSVV